MTEALALTSSPHEAGSVAVTRILKLSPLELDRIGPPHFEIPQRLTRRAIKAEQKAKGVFLHRRWNQRGDVTEFKTKNVIASVDFMVKDVTMNEPGAKGSDLKVIFVEDFPIGEAVIEVKSSAISLRQGKQVVRNEILSDEIRSQMIGPWTEKAWKSEWRKKIEEWNRKPLSERELAISSRLTETGRVLINAGEEDLREKGSDEIIRDSFFPQVERLIGVANGETPKQTVIAQMEGQRQIWPWVPPAKFTEIFPKPEIGNLNPTG